MIGGRWEAWSAGDTTGVDRKCKKEGEGEEWCVCVCVCVGGVLLLKQNCHHQSQ